MLPNFVKPSRLTSPACLLTPPWNGTNCATFERRPLPITKTAPQSTTLITERRLHDLDANPNGNRKIWAVSSEDMYAHDSIQLLKNSGIDFQVCPTSTASCHTYRCRLVVGLGWCQIRPRSGTIRVFCSYSGRTDYLSLSSPPSESSLVFIC